MYMELKEIIIEIVMGIQQMEQQQDATAILHYEKMEN